MWTCPGCDRRFGRTNQGHECLALVPLDEWLDAEAPWVAEVCRAVVAVVDGLGDDHVVEAAEVGLLIKRWATIIEVRPRRRWVDVSIKLHRRIEHPRIARVMTGQRSTWSAHIVRATAADDIDDDVSGWLAESYAEADPAG